MEFPPDYPKAERIAEFLRRLERALPARNAQGACEMIAAILNQVENEMTSIPFCPPNWRTDGRMYPVQMDNVRRVEGHPTVKRLRSKRHNTYVADNGALEIRAVDPPEILLSKPGGDGKGVWDA